ncbi:hypothetical protein [Spiroplasma sp. AdecLV25b]|uniref:hypothetical protein n=1 Tax=Spiroplasma sp. AdecLV25b TaxID=3027162 RepID=UPI0027DF66C7|nr:hypothetical protein [Spiroplasma sp. AdecLV25b]
MWVKISASSTDNNWTGSTDRIQLAINKNDLAKITALTGLNLSVNNTKKFSVLNSMLSTATEFKGNFFSKYTVKWFDAKIGGHDISNQLQSVRQVWVKITADSVDKNWQGTTPRLNININAANFNVIAGTTGAIVAMTADSSNNTIYAAGKTASDVGKVYKSNGTDAFVAMDGIDEPIIKMVTNNSSGKVYAISKTKVYVSTDGTAAFTEMTGISERLNSIAVSDDGTVYVGTNKGVYKSDGTNNFTIIPNNTDYIFNVAVFQNTLYFSTRTTVYKLTGPDKFTEIPWITEQVVNLSINTTSGAVYVTTFRKHANIWKSNGTDRFTKFLDLSVVFGQVISCSFDSVDYTFYYAIAQGNPMINRLFKIKDTETVATEISGVTDNMRSIVILNGVLYVGANATEFTGSVYKKN